MQQQADGGIDAVLGAGTAGAQGASRPRRSAGLWRGRPRPIAGRGCRGGCGGAAGSRGRRRSGGPPPWASTTRRKRSRAEPSLMARWARSGRLAEGLGDPRRAGASRRPGPRRVRGGRRAPRHGGNGRPRRPPPRCRRRGPAAGPSGSSRRRPPCPALGRSGTTDSARARESSREHMNAPSPVFTSRTRPSIPSASFLERIEAVMSGIDSTVAVASRSA